MFSIASIATMAACIFMFGMFYSIVINFQHVVKDVESGVAITVFFDAGTTQDQIDAIGQEIAMRPEVSSFNYVSAEEAWEEYKLEYFDGDEAAAASLVQITRWQENPTMRSIWRTFRSRAVWYLIWKA